MNLIKANFEIREPQFNFLKDIELIGRTCYKSEDKITETSCKDFVENILIKRNHLAMCEHGTIFLLIPNKEEFFEIFSFYSQNKYSICKSDEDEDYFYVTTNYRVILDNERQDDLKFQCEYTKHHENRISVKFVTDRGVSHEFVRNRGAVGNAFAQESTRYCNYSLNKFGMSITCIQPDWIKEEEQNEFEEDLKIIEGLYFKWLDKGWKPQQARGFLCNFTKTEIWITGTISDWGHFLYLRADKAAHPQAQELAYPLKEEFLKRGYLTEEDIKY